MNWAATDRYGLAHAPGALAVVQDLLNTTSAGRPRRPDLLDAAAVATTWANQALRAWGAEAGPPVEDVTLNDGDVEALRTLRTDLQVGIDGPVGADDVAVRVMRSVTLGADLRRDGVVALAPRGEGWRLLAGVVLLEIFTAQRVDDWRRLKICRNDRCSVAFFDRSRNNSGVWHDVKVCGNAVNLRASRARRRARAAG